MVFRAERDGLWLDLLCMASYQHMSYNLPPTVHGMNEEEGSDEEDSGEGTEGPSEYEDSDEDTSEEYDNSDDYEDSEDDDVYYVYQTDLLFL